MAYKGKYKPSYPKKYSGNPSNIIYRSLWERKYMKYLDTNENILLWSSEEFFIPYRSPIDGKIHKYFPDFMVKEQTSSGKIINYVVEIKPKRQCRAPKKPNNITKGYIFEAKEYAKNQSKWAVAKEWCADRGYEFRILTEEDLNIRY